MRYHLLSIPALSFLLIAAGYDYEPRPTESFSITGNVERELTVSVKDLLAIGGEPMGNLTLLNHKGEVKEVIKSMEGKLLRHILMQAGFPAEKPKDLNAYYFVCTTADSSKVVFSWNEIFNTSTGNNLYLVTAKNGVKIQDMTERILLVSKSDSITGRRYLKNLKNIRVERVK